MKLNLVIGGEAGQGLATLGDILGKLFFRLGYSVYTNKDYMSRIRGGHNFVQIRVGDERVVGPDERIDILIGLDKETIALHKDRLKPQGLILYHEEISGLTQKMLVIPTLQISKQIGNGKISNTVYVGVLSKILGLDFTIVENILKEYFGKGEIGQQNLEALGQGNSLGKELLPLPKVSAEHKDLLLDGNQAIGLGAAIAGVKFYSAYPMSPATGIMNYLAKKQDQLGIVVEQAEDEIGAINMALGASYIGIRAMTGTSGGGFALMNEALGLAGVGEIPLVIANVQRPGPATGLPTRTEQSDLLFIINSSQGEFPLMVIAPRDVEDAFYQSFHAFNLADKYQIPVILLSDQFLADSTCSVPELDLISLEINRHWMKEEDLSAPYSYQRYRFTADGISPRAYPGQFSDQIVLVDSHEHNESGNITEDPELRTKMVDKRNQKLKSLTKEDLLQPLYMGDEEIDCLVISWGSTYGAVAEAQSLLLEEGYKVGMLSFNHLWPLPTDMLLSKVNERVKVIVVENNATAQFARLIRGEVGVTADFTILKYTGRPFTGEEVYRRIKEEVLSNE